MIEKEFNLQEHLRDVAKNWPEGDTNLLHVKCTGIERLIPPESQHEYAIKALEYCKKARRCGDTEIGWLFVMKAESARKDFELYDGYIKSENFKPGRSEGSLSNKTKYIRKLAIDNKDKKAICLFLDADKSIIGNMKEGTFANHVSRARNLKT